MVTDYLHCVLLGVTKMLLNLWLDSSKHKGVLPWKQGIVTAKYSMSIGTH